MLHTPINSFSVVVLAHPKPSPKAVQNYLAANAFRIATAAGLLDLKRLIADTEKAASTFGVLAPGANIGAEQLVERSNRLHARARILQAQMPSMIQDADEAALAAYEALQDIKRWRPRDPADVACRDTLIAAHASALNHLN